MVPPWLDDPPLLLLAFFFRMESDCVMVVLWPSLW